MPSRVLFNVKVFKFLHDLFDLLLGLVFAKININDV
jgi:hypothetical protein